LEKSESTRRRLLFGGSNTERLINLLQWAINNSVITSESMSGHVALLNDLADLWDTLDRSQQQQLMSIGQRLALEAAMGGEPSEGTVQALTTALARVSRASGDDSSDDTTGAHAAWRQNIARALLGERVAGEPAQESESDGVRLRAQRLLASGLSGLRVAMAARSRRNVTFELPSNIVDRLSEHTDVDVVSWVSDNVWVPRHGERPDAVSQVVGLELSDADTTNAVAIQDLEEPIYLTIPIGPRNASRRCACRYWNNTDWSAFGVWLHEELQDAVVCKTNHLSEFIVIQTDGGSTPGSSSNGGSSSSSPGSGSVPGNDKKKKTSPAKMDPMLLGAIAGAVVVVIVVGIVLKKKSKKKAGTTPSKVTPIVVVPGPESVTNVCV
jgi:hypothetical protein